MTLGLDYNGVLEELGSFGRFQRRQILLILFAALFILLHGTSYIFTAANIDYRCRIEECDLSVSEQEYTPDWLAKAVPYGHSVPAKCERFASAAAHRETERSACPAEWFDRNVTERCDNFVFNTKHIMIVQDFGIYCKENLWKLTLVGTIHNIGQFVSILFGGIFADRYGRQEVLQWTILLSTIAGLIRSFSPNYICFMIMEFCDAGFGTTAYVCAFILGTELLGPSHRVTFAVILFILLAFTSALFGLAAWWIISWRTLIQVTYTPSFLIVIYFWISIESIRWLVAKRRCAEAETRVKRAATLNGITLSQEAIEVMQRYREKGGDVIELKSESDQTYPIKDVYRSARMLLRVANCSFAWITCAFVFYGLSLNSVEIGGNSYLNYIAVSMVEIPGYLVSYVCLNRFGRRPSLCASFLIAGISCMVFIFIEPKLATLKLCVYLCGKCAISIAFLTVYVYTSELFPTPVRQTLMGICSTFGRFGTILAPQMPLLALIWPMLPLALFAGISILAGLLVLLLPETLNTKLPDTVHEAEHIGTRK